MTSSRKLQAAGTRMRIVQAARGLFVVSGYAGTTVEAIAAEAGVAVATVYKTFGTKAAVARELNDLIDGEAGFDELITRVESETEPGSLIDLAVAQLRTQHEQCGDIIAAIRSGALVDMTLARVWDEGTRRYDAGLRAVVDRLNDIGALAPGVEIGHAVGILAVLCSTESFQVFTGRFGWTGDEWEIQTCRTLRAVLFVPTDR